MSAIENGAPAPQFKSLGALSLYALILLWQKTAVNLYVAHKKTDWRAVHEALLVCFLLSCSTWIINCMLLTIVQHMNYQLHASYYRAAHELLIACFLLSCSTRIITHVQHTKIARMQYTKVDLRVAHFISHVCFDSRHDKNWRTPACSLQACVNLDVSCTIAMYV